MQCVAHIVVLSFAMQKSFCVLTEHRYYDDDDYDVANWYRSGTREGTGMWIQSLFHFIAMISCGTTVSNRIEWNRRQPLAIHRLL